MRKREVSIRGELIGKLMKNMMDTAVGHGFQTGEYRRNPVEAAWICPEKYEYELIDMIDFSMEYLKPKDISTGRIILQLHGGGYIGPMKNIYRDFAVRFSKRSLGADVLTIDYRVAPEQPYPAALLDAVTAYEWLLKEKQYPAEKIVVVGDSAGGGLALALVMYLRDFGMPMPAGVITMSPWTDLTCSGKSHETNNEKDPQFGNTKDSMLYHNPYIGDADPKEPYLSPLFGQFHDLPPILMQVGAHEVLLSDTLDVADKIRTAHGKLRVSVYDGMFHVFQMALDLIPESKEAWGEISTFLQIIYGIQREPKGVVVKRVKSRSRRNL